MMVATDYQNEARFISHEGRSLIDRAVSAGRVLVEVPLMPRLSAACPETDEVARISSPVRRAILTIERRYDQSGLTSILIWPATNYDAQQLRDWVTETTGIEG